MARLELVVEGWVPIRLNAMMRMHWSKRGRALRQDAQSVTLAALAAGLPRAEGPRRLDVTFSGWPGQNHTLPDADGLLKSGLDAAVAAGLLVDDSPEFLVLGRVSVVRGPKRTTFTVEDLAPQLDGPTSGGGPCRTQQAGQRDKPKRQPRGS